MLVLAFATGLATPVQASNTELTLNPVTKKWERVAAGERKAAALRKWANASPIAPEIIPFKSAIPAGSILVRTQERRLYLILDGGRAKRFGIGVGREGFTWKGREKISRKAEWPSWTPPEEMKRREEAKGRILPERMDGGLDNPMGARALYLGSTAFRIHGTNEPWTIGGAVSSGCIRLANEDIIELYSLAKVGATVLVE